MAIPDARTHDDVAVAARLAFAHPAAGDEDGWGLRFGRELNATDDKAHFSAHAHDALPVVEGKQIQPFSYDLARSRNFISRAAAAALIADRAFTRARLAYRDVAASSNRVTLIAAVLPADVVTTHTLFCLKTALHDDVQHFLCGMFNSFVANYFVRLRVNTHVTVGVIDRLPLPCPDREGRAFKDMVALARYLSSHPADPEAAAFHQALAARIYGVTAREFEHILGTFPLVNRPVRDAAMVTFRRTL
jgi:hypothetical protein